MKNAESLIPFAQLGQTANLRLLLRHGADPNERDERGWTSLHWAAQEGFLNIVRCLIRFGAEVDLSDDIGFTPLRIAAGAGYEGIVRELLRAGASVNRKNPTDGNSTALHLACSWKQLSVVKVLLESSDIEINARDDDGTTPLAFALDAGDRKIIAFLQKRGATK